LPNNQLSTLTTSINLSQNFSTTTTQFQPIGPVTLNCATLAATLGLNSHVIKVGLLLVNGKYQLNSTTAASLYVTDIVLSGTSTAGSSSRNPLLSQDLSDRNPTGALANL
jgi:hypothetical protein